MAHLPLGVLVLSSIALFTTANGLAPPAPQSAAFRIVVIKGEDAVNIIQQKTAVAPVVEVRDRNNLPVPGVAVTFSIGGQGASFAGGVQSISVVTNAAGQAAAAGLTPTAAGAIQIQATAVFQGQTAIATITQSNVMTAAQATTAATSGTSSATGGSGSTATAGVTAGGGGGGSGTTSTGSSPTTTAPTTTSTTTPTPSPPTPPTPTPTPAPQPTSSSFSGDVEGILSGPGSLWVDGRGNVVNCPAQYREAARVTLTLVTQPSGEVSGNLSFVGRTTDASGDTCSSMPEPDFPVSFTGPVTGTSSGLRFTHDYRQTGNMFG